MDPFWLRFPTAGWLLGPRDNAPIDGVVPAFVRVCSLLLEGKSDGDSAGGRGGAGGTDDGDDGE